jgi:hypothetical protein
VAINPSTPTQPLATGKFFLDFYTEKYFGNETQRPAKIRSKDAKSNTNDLVAKHNQQS